MSEQPYRHQDESGRRGPGLGVFLNGVMVAKVDDAADPYGHAAMWEADLGAEVLLICHRHHDVAAVDCEECDPA